MGREPLAEKPKVETGNGWQKLVITTLLGLLAGGGVGSTMTDKTQRNAEEIAALKATVTGNHRETTGRLGRIETMLDKHFGDKP